MSHSTPSSGSGAWAFLRRPVALLAAVGAVLIVVAGGAYVLWSKVSGGPTKTIYARFPETPGLYVGNRVAVLGIAKGEVTKLTISGTYIEVRMSVPASLKLPADVKAAMVAPNPVSDRTIELYPPYKGGPVLRDGALIPLADTAVPMSIDAIFSRLDEIAKALGPNGANKNGALADVISSAANLTNGTGADLHATLQAIAGALPAFTQNPAQLKRLLTSLGQLTTLLAQHNSTIDSVLTSVTTATSQIAAERQTIQAAIVNLQSALEQVVQFINANRTHLSSALQHLVKTSQALVSDQAALRTTFSTAPLGFQNFDRLVDHSAPCVDDPHKTCAAAFARVDLPIGSPSITTTYCQDLATTFAPFLLTVQGIKELNKALKALQPATTLGSACLAQHALVDGWPQASPGAPKVPELGLAAFLK